jgi:streptomycin 6-kinase
VIEVPPVVRNVAETAGAAQWLVELPALVEAIARDWSLRVGRVYPDATEALVADATLDDGSPAVLKLLVPREEIAANEITALRLANGEGCVRLLRDDVARGALLLERLGRSLSQLALSSRRRHEILCDLAARVWRPAPDCGLPTGAETGQRLIDIIEATWDAIGRPARSAPSTTRSHARAAASPRTTTSARCSRTATCTSGMRSRRRAASGSSIRTEF